MRDIYGFPIDAWRSYRAFPASINVPPRELVSGIQVGKNDQDPSNVGLDHQHLRSPAAAHHRRADQPGPGEQLRKVRHLHVGNSPSILMMPSVRPEDCDARSGLKGKTREPQERSASLVVAAILFMSAKR